MGHSNVSEINVFVGEVSRQVGLVQYPPTGTAPAASAPLRRTDRRFISVFFVSVTLLFVSNVLRCCCSDHERVGRTACHSLVSPLLLPRIFLCVATCNERITLA